LKYKEIRVDEKEGVGLAGERNREWYSQNDMLRGHTVFLSTLGSYGLVETIGQVE
jgi:hypothetical protein